MNRIIYLSLLCFCFSCNTKAQDAMKKVESDCGKITTYTCDADYLKGSDKKEIFFSIDVPENFSVQTLADQKNSYFKIMKIEEDKVDEFISFGHLYSSEGMTDEKILDRLYSIADMIQGAGYVEEESQLLKTTFDGKEYHVFQAIGSFPESAGQFAGDFLYNIVAVPYDEQKILLVVMMANNEGHDYKFYDFEDRMCISEIWRSIKFLN